MCGNTTPVGRSVFTKFRVFPISTSVDITVYLYGKNVLYFFYNIAQKKYKITSMDERREIFCVYIELCKHGSQPINDQNSQMLYYNVSYCGTIVYAEAFWHSSYFLASQLSGRQKTDGRRPFFAPATNLVSQKRPKTIPVNFSLEGNQSTTETPMTYSRPLALLFLHEDWV